MRSPGIATRGYASMGKEGAIKETEAQAKEGELSLRARCCTTSGAPCVCVYPYWKKNWSLGLGRLDIAVSHVRCLSGVQLSGPTR